MLIEYYVKETPERMKKMILAADALFSEVRNIEVNRIVITGSGTSYHSGVQIRDYLSKFSGIPVDVYYPFMVNERVLKDKKTLFIGISQGGSSYSTYRAMKLAKEQGCLTASMAGTQEAFIDEVADFILTVDCGEENAGAKTKGYHCTKLNLMLLALQLGLARGNINDAEYKNEIEKFEKGIANFYRICSLSEKWIDDNQEKFVHAEDIRIIGTGEIYGDTLEGALKLLETLRIPVTGYEFEEFIHGVYNAINEKSTIIIFDTGVEPRVSKLVEVLSQWTSNIFIIGSYETNSIQDMEGEFIRDFEYIIPIQLICAKVPLLKGIEPDIPKDPSFHMKLNSKKMNR